jgi:transposase-like protein
MSKARGRHDEGKERFWRELLSEFDPKRTSIRQWCADHGVSEPSFYAWRRELESRDRKRARSSRPKQRVSLIPVRVQPASHSAKDRPATRLVVDLPGKVRLYVTIEQLPGVLDVLEARSC